MLEFKNVDVSVGKIPILEDISVNFETGKITSLVGPNGCGKTTLLQTLNGVSKVNSGEILLDGANFLEYSSRDKAKRLSFMPQFRENAPNISVKGLVEHGRFAYMGFSRTMSDEDKALVNSAIEFVHIEDYRNCMVSELSGGIQQRVYLAMQLAQNSQYMVLDEPMNHLDFEGQREMYQMISRLKEKKTIVMVSHDLNHALKISDYVVVMSDRKIVYKGTPLECIESGAITDTFNCKISSAVIEGEKHYIFV